MKNYIIMVLLAVAAHNACAQDKPGEGARLLFKNNKSLSAADQNKIFKMSGLKMSRDKKQFAEEGGEDYPFDAYTYLTDLNKDNVPEVFILYGNSYTSGATGQSMMIFIKDAQGNYQNVLSTIGASPDALSTMNKGYPDLVVGGPGFEWPVMRWNGKAYDNYRTIKDAEYGKAKKQSIEDAGKAYAAGH